MKIIVMFCVISINSLFAYNIADSFQYPVSTSDGIYSEDKGFGWFVAQDHQDCRKQAVPTGITPCRHLGEDWNYYDGKDYSNGGRTIVAVANGYVVKAGVKKGFAGYIILKHYLNSNDSSKYVLSIYGHVKTSGLPNKGTYFKKGQILTKTATHTEMKKWTTFDSHLHFEIRKSKTLTGYEDSYLNDGYDKSNNKYYDPTDVRVYDYSSNTNFLLLSDWNTEKGFIESYKPANNSSSTSIIDGAGSLVSPNEYCWGCDRDQANMQSHSGENSTVVFQWRYDKNSCSQIDISADRDIGNVLIRAKGWKDKVTKVATSVKLSSSPISIRRPNRKSNWTTLAVTTQKPLSKTAKIYAYCKKKGSTYLNGNRGSASKDFVNFNLDYVWSGTGSLISRSKKSNYDGFGHNRDWAITYFKKKSLTTFQWDSTTCHEITITNGKTDDYYANNVKVDIKGWDFKDWKSACYELPCTIKKTNDYYYILKIKSPVKAITKGYIQVKCENQ